MPQAILYLMNLLELGKHYGTDKVGHGYLPFYEKYMKPLREKPLKILEIGVWTGASHQMWNDYFPNAQIYGIDNFVTNGAILSIHKLESIIKFAVADQGSRFALEEAMKIFGNTDFDVIVDDGGHKMNQQQVSLGFLFPYLKSNGLYFIEDLTTSFETKYGAEEDGSNTTLTLLQDLESGTPLSSQYMTPKELDYLTKQTASCKVAKTNDIISVIQKKHS